MILQTLAHQHPNLVKSIIISNSALYRESTFHYYLQAQLTLLKASPDKATKSAIIQAACSWAFSFQFLSQENVLQALIDDKLNDPHPFTLPGYEAQLEALLHLTPETGHTK